MFSTPMRRTVKLQDGNTLQFDMHWTSQYLHHTLCIDMPETVTGPQQMGPLFLSR